MAVKQVGEMYRCNLCGNEVTVTRVGGGILVCCGRDMEKIDSGEYEIMRRDLPSSEGGDSAGE
jgi:desulfoferrodoxin-like iron-binding protein